MKPRIEKRFDIYDSATIFTPWSLTVVMHRHGMFGPQKFRYSFRRLDEALSHLELLYKVGWVIREA